MPWAVETGAFPGGDMSTACLAAWASRTWLLSWLSVDGSSACDLWTVIEADTPLDELYCSWCRLVLVSDQLLCNVIRTMNFFYES